ncbi:MAG: hypothetical protein LBD06_00360 [Candidatus Accumulibacter sp.]|nr:hypothetical protein [Accumulibacter sp.]
MLLTGEALDASVRSRIAEAIMGIENVQGDWNGIIIAEEAQIDDSFIASRVEARLDEARPPVASHVFPGIVNA